MDKKNVNFTVRVDPVTVKEFRKFCENAGLTASSAINLLIRNTLRYRRLPFPVVDLVQGPSDFTPCREDPVDSDISSSSR